MANREQKNKDKANMKKKQEKKQAASKSSSSSSSASALAELPASLTNLLDNLQQKTTASLSHLGTALSALSVTRLSPSLFDSLPVPLADGSTPSLSSLSSISNRSANSVVVSLFDPEHLKPVTRALSTHRLPGQADNVNPQLEQEAGETRLVVRWTRQGREAKDDMRRDISKKGEEVKAAIRSHRQAALVGLKRASGSEEEKEQIRSRLQEIVDESIADVERAVKDKEKEITES